MRTRITFLLPLFLVACGEKQPAGECQDNGQCGDMQICTKEQTCKDVECLASTDCKMNRYCDNQGEGRTYTCKDGCGEDSDCFAGEKCNVDSHACEEYGCRSTDLDCNVGEVCDEASGDCGKAPGKWCAKCEGILGTTCDRGYTCVVASMGADGFCYPECDPAVEDACPRGFYCGQVFVDDPKTYCYGDCDYYTKNGYITP